MKMNIQTEVRNLQAQAQTTVDHRGQVFFFTLQRRNLELGLQKADPWHVFSAAVKMAAINPALCAAALRCPFNVADGDVRC
jgi:tRNA U34 2-thiouridine synthase MnmA/TrmU